ncbi:MAG TPA: heparinase, partial [Curvibacter sp.]|nr:heparinase [Curvibacter sp.]
LLPLTDTSYRDFRPSLQLAMVLFAGRRALGAPGAWDHALSWLGLVAPAEVAAPAGSYQSDKGGFAILRRGAGMAMLRYPRFRFRPSQADALHLDLSLGGDNLLRDAGTYSYNTEAVWMDYFGGTAGHNTVQFDGRDQMPKLSRFLWGNWLRTSSTEGLLENAADVHFSAAYRDAQGACHRRRVFLGEGHLRVEDEVAGFRQRAVLRWRLAPGHWTREGIRLTNGAHTLMVQGSMPIIRCEITEGWESRHYLEKTPVPVLEVEIEKAGTLTTDYQWAA